MSRIQLPECYILAKHWKNDDDITTCWHNVIVKFFWCCFVSLVKLSYWSKFYANIITFSGVMTIFFYKGLTRNPEIGNTPVWVLLTIWRLGRVRAIKFGTNVSNKMSLNAAKCQDYSFYRFWVIKGKATGRVKLSLTPSQIRVISEIWRWSLKISDILWKILIVENGLACLSLSSSLTFIIIIINTHEIWLSKPFEHQPHKMVKHAQTIRQLFECVWPLCGAGVGT